jgi:hypothetical protein
MPENTQFPSQSAPFGREDEKAAQLRETGNFALTSESTGPVDLFLTVMTLNRACSKSILKTGDFAR